MVLLVSSQSIIPWIWGTHHANTQHRYDLMTPGMAYLIKVSHGTLLDDLLHIINEQNKFLKSSIPNFAANNKFTLIIPINPYMLSQKDSCSRMYGMCNSCLGYPWM